MGLGADFTRDAARKEALKALQNYYVQNQKYKTCACQIAKLNSSRTKGVLPDGTTIDIQPVGLPGDYAMTCPLHSTKRAALKPEPVQVQSDGVNNTAFIIGRQSQVPTTGNPLVETKSGFTISQLSVSPFYMRYVGKSKADDKKLYRIPLDYLDPRADLGNIQIKLSADGKCLLVGGFFQNYPEFNLYANQISSGTGGCGGNCIPIDGYNYHTYATWAVFAGVSLDTQNPSGSNIVFKSVHTGSLDITEECYNKITAPQEKGLGSASVYRLFPTISDIKGFGVFSGQEVDLPGIGGYRVDIQGNPVDARFFPNARDSYTWDGLNFVLRPGNPEWYVEDYTYTQTGLGGEASLITTWRNDAKNHALFLNGRRSDIRITDSNLVYSFNGDETGTVYTVDIIGDISFATVYQVVSSDLRTSGNVRYTTNSGSSQSFVNCDYGQHTYSEFNYEYESEYYPWLNCHYNSFADVNIMVSSSTTNKLYQPFGPNIHEFSSEGSVTNIQNDTGETFFSSTDRTVSMTSCGLKFFNFNSPFPQEARDWVEHRSPGDGQFTCSACTFQGVPSGYYQLCCVESDIHTVINWDGSGVVLIDDPSTPLYGLDCFWPRLITLNGQIGLCDQDLIRQCCTPVLYGYTVENTYRDIGRNMNGFQDAYRYGRGISSFNGVTQVINTGSDNYTSNSVYLGPAIQIARLSSHSNQNHVLGAFRGTSGGRACVYQVADPFTIQDANGGVIDLTEYVDDFAAGLRGEANEFFDALFNGENVLFDDPSNRFANANETTRPSDNVFSRYFWATPYVSIGTNLPVSANENLSALPPDVFTDRILAPFGTFPLFTQGETTFGINTLPPSNWNILTPDFEDEQPSYSNFKLQFPCNQLRGVDSFIVNGYLKLTVEEPNATGTGTTKILTTFITRYDILPTGATNMTIAIKDGAAIQNELVLDYLIPVRTLA